MYQTREYIGRDSIDRKDLLGRGPIDAGVMDHGIEAPPRVGCVGNTLGFVDVGQIAGDDVRRAWHTLFCMTSAFSIARVQDDLVPLIDQCLGCQLA